MCCANILLVAGELPLASQRGHRGSIAQLGEHLPYKQRVTGSSPVTSIFFASTRHAVKKGDTNIGEACLPRCLYHLFSIYGILYNLSNKYKHLFAPENERMIPPMKENYVIEIIKLLEQCNDISLLDLIHKLLEKTV